jgi:hypothetical protein
LQDLFWSRRNLTALAGSRMADRKEHLQLTADNFRSSETTPATVSRLRQLSPTVRGVTLAVQPAHRATGFKVVMM